MGADRHGGLPPADVGQPVRHAKSVLVQFITNRGGQLEGVAFLRPEIGGQRQARGSPFDQTVGGVCQQAVEGVAAFGFVDRKLLRGSFMGPAATGHAVWPRNQVPAGAERRGGIRRIVLHQ